VLAEARAQAEEIVSAARTEAEQGQVARLEGELAESRAEIARLRAEIERIRSAG
jgi:molecular chaperone GrpE (heat shock protein)